jgi:hypothetical protein
LTVAASFKYGLTLFRHIKILLIGHKRTRVESATDPFTRCDTLSQINVTSRQVNVTIRIEGDTVAIENDQQIHPGLLKFKSILQTDVPKGRDGKHKQIISQLLDEITQLAQGSALKIPLADLPDTKENIRSALSRAARQKNLGLSTSSDNDHLYIWRT